MMRLWTNYAIDVLLFLTGLILAVSSLLVWVVVPEGYNVPWLFWIAVHKWSGFALFIEALLHVALHGRWIWAMTRGLLRGRGKLASARDPLAARTPAVTGSYTPRSRRAEPESG